MHTMVLGTSTYGKSYYLKQKTKLAKKLHNIPTIVLDPHLGTGWGADFVTDDPYKFLEVAKRNRRCYVYIDECDETLGAAGSKQFRQMSWFGAQGSHMEHHVHFVAQYYTMIPPKTRSQCTQGIIFHQKQEDSCKALVKEFAGNPQLEFCYKLPKYHYFAIGYKHLDPKKVYSLKL